MMRKLAFFLPLFLPLLLRAEPMHIAFPEMIDKSKTIVLADFLGPADSAGPFGHWRWKLKVEQVLKGKVSGDTLIVTRAHGEAYLEKGVCCLAFINADGGFEWVGRISNCGKPENGIVFLEGFYDYNAYIVAPCTITMKQLKDYLATEQYQTTVSGYLHFFSTETKKMEPSPVHFTIKYTYRKDGKGATDVQATNMKLVDFPARPQLSLGAWENTISVIYESNMVRPLKIEGEILEAEGLDASGSGYKALFWLEEPEELTEKEFYQFLADPSVGYASYEVDVITKENTYVLRLDEEYGRIGDMHGYGGGKREIHRLGSPEADRKETIEFGWPDPDLYIELDQREPDREKLKYSSNRFIRDLRIKPFEGTLVSKTGGKEQRRPCTLVYRKTKFEPNANFGK